MAEKCENKECNTGRQDIVLHVPTKVVGGMVVERTPMKLCGACAKLFWKNDPGVFKAMSPEEIKAADEMKARHQPTEAVA